MNSVWLSLFRPDRTFDIAILITVHSVIMYAFAVMFYGLVCFVWKGYTIPEGDMLMLSPFWCHRNPTLFPEPQRFQPVRFAVLVHNLNSLLKNKTKCRQPCR